MSTKKDNGSPAYLNDKGQGVELTALRDSLDMICDIVFACRDNIDDFIEMHCGNGMYQGHFMLMKFGLERAMSMLSEITPATDGSPEADSKRGGAA